MYSHNSGSEVKSKVPKPMVQRSNQADFNVSEIYLNSCFSIKMIQKLNGVIIIDNINFKMFLSAAT